jgi:hypothetical protein
MAVVYALFAISIFAWWGHASYQLIHAYVTIGEFDVSVDAFWGITLYMFGPLLVVGALLARGTIQRIRMHLWFKKIVHVTEYKTNFSPAEAGYLADDGHNLSEAYATLLDLHFRGVITIERTPGGLVLIWHGALGANAYESTLIRALFGQYRSVTVTKPDDYRLIVAAAEALPHLSFQLRGQLSGRHRQAILHPALTRLIRFIYWVAGAVGLLNIYNHIFYHEEVSQIMYPRYDLEPSQLVLVGITWIVMLAIVATAFWPRFTSDRNSKPVQAWLQAFGFRRYIATVYKDRMSTSGFPHQRPQDIAYFAPYMLAFEIIPVSLDYIGAAAQYRQP